MLKLSKRRGTPYRRNAELLLELFGLLRRHESKKKGSPKAPLFV